MKWREYRSQPCRLAEWISQETSTTTVTARTKDAVKPPPRVGGAGASSRVFGKTVPLDEEVPVPAPASAARRRPATAVTMSATASTSMAIALKSTLFLSPSETPPWTQLAFRFHRVGTRSKTVSTPAETMTPAAEEESRTVTAQTV